MQRLLQIASSSLDPSSDTMECCEGCFGIQGILLVWFGLVTVGLCSLRWVLLIRPYKMVLSETRRSRIQGMSCVVESRLLLQALLSSCHWIGVVNGILDRQIVNE